MEIDELISNLDNLRQLIEYSKNRGNPKWEEYNEYYISVCRSEEIQPKLKGTIHYNPSINDIRDEKINILLG